MPISTAVSPDALLVIRGNTLIAFPFDYPEWRRFGLKGSRSIGICRGPTRSEFWWRRSVSKSRGKGAALGHSLIQNHPFVDDNKRIGHGAMEVFLLLNGYELEALVDEQEQVIIGVASGRISRSECSEWLAKHLIEVERTA